MKLLVVGAGGREHALAWALSRSPRVSHVYVAPGNGGTAREPGVSNIDLADFGDLIAFARREAISITIVGPEAPLAGGIVDAFQAAGLAIFGPTREAARLESSKEFAKAFMIRHAIPTAAYGSFTEPGPAHAYIDEQGAPIVVKADGLAAGKGVIVALNLAEAHAAVDDMLTGNSMGEAGSRVVVEACLTGEEASFIAVVGGGHVLALASSQDHKRLCDGDAGPNTGGMGAYSPAPVVDARIHGKIMREIIEPAVRGMAADGRPFTGFLYAGVMVSADGAVRALEFNCRLGDPETQPIMMRLRTDFATVIEAAIAGELHALSLDWDPRPALGVVIAAENYPTAPLTGVPIHGLPANGNAPGPDCMVFHAGTRQAGEDTVSSGGRVLCVTAMGATVGDAQQAAYDAVDRLRFDGMQFRRDIGYRALQTPGSASKEPTGNPTLVRARAQCP